MGSSLLGLAAINPPGPVTSQSRATSSPRATGSMACLCLAGATTSPLVHLVPKAISLRASSITTVLLHSYQRLRRDDDSHSNVKIGLGVNYTRKKVMHFCVPSILQYNGHFVELFEC